MKICPRQTSKVRRKTGQSPGAAVVTGADTMAPHSDHRGLVDRGSGSAVDMYLLRVDRAVVSA